MHHSVTVALLTKPCPIGGSCYGFGRVIKVQLLAIFIECIFTKGWAAVAGGAIIIPCCLGVLFLHHDDIPFLIAMRTFLAASLALPALVAGLQPEKRSVTVYNPTMTSTSTAAAADATYTGAAAYDTTVLNPPAPPTDLVKDFPVQLLSGGMDGLSIKQKGSFMGFSIELSVADQIRRCNEVSLAGTIPEPHVCPQGACGQGLHPSGRQYAGSRSDVPRGLQHRICYPKVPPTRFHAGELSAPCETRLALTSRIDRNPFDLLLARYYFGLNWIDPNNFTNSVLVAETVESILGSDLLALYDQHGKRPQSPYTFDIYMNEFQQAVTQLNAAPAFTNKDILLAPSSCCMWNETELFQAGFVERFKNDLKILAVQHYPTNNCKINGNILDPQAIYPDFLRHANTGYSPVSMVNPYRSSSAIAQQYGKPIVMLETNTASCGGFPGISDSFGAALWAADLAFQLASANFSQVLLHVGGQNVYYNPFTPPPTNQSTFHQWTTGAIFYATLVTAEAFGPSGNSQIVDLFMNGGSDYTPGYAIYENGSVVLFNYITDPSGASDYVAHIAIGGGQTGQPAAIPNSVKVRRLSAASVNQKYNVTWAGQTMGDQFNSDGRMKGELQTETIQCDTAAGSCAINVKAPSIVLVFLNDQTLADSTPPNEGPQTFATTAATVQNPQHRNRRPGGALHLEWPWRRPLRRRKIG
ncbi:glycoside hydrolase family 79 protein [Rhizoctonia solani AG-1 IA]|uniref:Glycoside hydrolase family 79 protein n=1 Tax=Thanatephorus cucumeris (strain AG1-IA) TaxID=983506 RepID=L8WS79_THACA|nr:glycoside hydrolase family 79 protein [Rhizoctonia solani AG-1 IA]